MRTTIVMLGCLFASAAFAAEQMEKNAEAHATAKPVVVAKATTKRQAAQPAKSEGQGRVWTLEMSCCEPQ
jgi:hypothetical protein